MEDKKDKKKFWSSGFLTVGYLRDMLIIALLIVMVYKIANSDFTISFQNLVFSDLLSVLLAFFAIALSAAFYFKATETSNTFYDNTYKFTKEISEILGRIEAGFGERLKHIDEGYTGLRDKFDNMPFDINEAKEEEEKEEEHIKMQEKERNQIILDLMKKAQVADDEKERLLKELESHTSELDSSKNELRKLQRKISEVESDTTDVSSGFINHLSKLIDGRFTSKYIDAPVRILQRRFHNILEDKILDEHDLGYMQHHGLVDSDHELTSKGARVMREAIRHAI